MLRKIRLAVASLVVSVAAYAQSTYGTIYGSVTDPSSAVIKEAIVEAKNPSTGAVRSVKTGADGTFRFVNLDPGSYSISATASGFSSQEKRITLPARSAAKKAAHPGRKTKRNSRTQLLAGNRMNAI